MRVVRTKKIAVTEYCIDYLSYDLMDLSEQQRFLIADSLKERIWHKRDDKLQLDKEDLAEIAELEAMIEALE